MEVFIKGVEVLIDDEDYELFSKYKWFINKQGYLHTYIYINKKRKWILYHRLTLGLTDPKIITDHINRNRLDNRRCNLRVCGKKENARNTSSRKNCTSKYLGVYLIKSGKWYARCYNKHLGSFITEEEAALAYNKEAMIRYGEFASLNIIK